MKVNLFVLNIMVDWLKKKKKLTFIEDLFCVKHYFTYIFSFNPLKYTTWLGLITPNL